MFFVDDGFSEMSFQRPVSRTQASERENTEETEPVSDAGRSLQFPQRHSDMQALDTVTGNKLIEKIVIHNPKKICDD